MKPILRQGDLTDARDSNSPSNLARLKRPWAAGAACHAMRLVRHTLSISRFRRDSETLLGAYGYVIRRNRNRQQMAA